MNDSGRQEAVRFCGRGGMSAGKKGLHMKCDIATQIYEQARLEGKFLLRSDEYFDKKEQAGVL